MRIVTVRLLELPIVDHHWPWREDNADRIAERWARSLEAKPALFDGRVLMMRGGAAAADLYEANFFETDFSAFLAWQDLGFPDKSVRNGFGMAALRGSDGGFVLGVMADHTANAGRIYFPAGTPDRSDIRDAAVDLAGSVERELLEETGLARPEVAFEDRWHVVEFGTKTGFLRPVSVDAPAAEVAAEIDARLRRQVRPELSGMHVVRRRADVDPARMPDFLVHWFESVLAE
jgi:8-oxo-dGTP pyrophosphatase MutT (NUDIX family)